MEKIFLISILILTILTIILFQNFLKLTGFFVGFGEPKNATWWNTSWHYRIEIKVNSSIEIRNWPVEIYLNFSEYLPEGLHFDNNSIRVIEYDLNGNILYEVPSQFDEGEGYSPTNAVGTLVFLLNGSTLEQRRFFVYYDALENGEKELKTYPSSLSYNFDGEKIQVNTSYFKIFIDTNRGQNLSGIYRVEDNYENVIVYAPETQRPVEYLNYFNETDLSFDLRFNATFIEGPIRLTILQKGYEFEIGNISNKTNETMVIKKYYIYDKAGPQAQGSFIKIEQSVKNLASYPIVRNSSGAGALAFDVGRTFSSGSINLYDLNSTDPFSWVWVTGIGGEMVGIINLEENGTSNFYATYNSNLQRVGIELNSTLIETAGKIRELSLVYFGTGGGLATTEFLNIKEGLMGLNVEISEPEILKVIIYPSTNATIYNRNETILIKAEIEDFYNVSFEVNATLSNDDGFTLKLYDDGTHGDEVANDKIFTNFFTLSNSSNLGLWKINFTVYDQYGNLLNSTLHTFTVTDKLWVEVNVKTKKVIVGSLVLANVSVKNYRNDTFVHASLNCSFDSQEVLNLTDYNNGTYELNFTAPSEIGTYNLTCDASKDGNFGQGFDFFETQASQTYFSIQTIPSNQTLDNVTYQKGQNFSIEVKVKNVGEATGYAVNISLSLPSNWFSNSTFESCEDMNPNQECVKSFEIYVPEASEPNVYYLNISTIWQNPDYSLNQNETAFNVTILSNPLLEVLEDSISGYGKDGKNFLSF